jgi:hypothetical protein
MVVLLRVEKLMMVPMSVNSSGMRMKRHRKRTACSACLMFSSGSSFCTNMQSGVAHYPGLDDISRFDAAASQQMSGMPARVLYAMEELHSASKATAQCRCCLCIA